MNITNTVRRALTSALLLVLLSWTEFAKAYVLDNGIVIGSDESDEPITCWTCPNKTNNEECNDWAPDLSCPTNHTVCKTVHRLELYSGRSVSVLKQCAREKECTQSHIGCHSTGSPGIVDCVSCCNKAYCNEEVAHNQSHALLLSALDTSSSHRLSPTWTSILLCAVFPLLSQRFIGFTRTSSDMIS